MSREGNRNHTPVFEVLEGTTGSLGMNYQNFLGAVAGVEVLGKDLVLKGAHTEARRGRWIFMD